ncbi:gp7 [Burkholderia phage KS14]|uniref:Gp7 n=2 Tax=Kisquattuordecimvirus TaxID=2732982 RepID=E5FFG0_9CAUD|nr:gp7 [Burkholderia phage KS14]ADP02352.1 gp7 [Burkholderia phage KS14]
MKGEAWFNVDAERMRRDLYIGTFAPTPRTQLDELAAEYHERCEAYDRLVCTGPIIHGSIMPATAHELRLIGRNARAVLRELAERAAMLGYSSRQLTKAIQENA